MQSYLASLPLEERAKKMQELEAQERDFVASQEMRREAARIEGQRRDLERHLTERGRRYVENTGAQPTEATLAAWRDEWTDAREREHEADNRRRYEAAGYDQAGQRDTIF